MDKVKNWGLIFTQIEPETNEVIQLLPLSMSSETEARRVFNKIKNEFKGKKDNCCVDLVNENDDIIDDYPLSIGQVDTIANLLGYAI